MPGAEALANGVAGAKLGLYPRRNPWDRICEEKSQVYVDRAFDEEMAASILRVRNKLKMIGACRKVRFDIFEIAAAALSARLAQREKQRMEKLSRRLQATGGSRFAAASG